MPYVSPAFARRVSLRGRSRFAAVAAAAAACAAALSASAQTYSTSSQKDTLVESGSSPLFSGATRVTAEGDSAGSFAAFSVLDFNTTGLAAPSGQIFTGLSDNTLTLTLVDRAPLDNFAVSGPISFYLATNTAALTNSNTFQGYSNTGGVGNQLGNLTLLGNANYVAGTDSANHRTDTLTFNFGSSLASYVLNQVETGGILRVLLTPGSGTVEANYEGSSGSTNPVLAAPKLGLDLTTSPVPASDAVFNINGNVSNKVQTVTVNRLYTAGTASASVVVTNGGTGTGYLSFAPSSTAVTGSVGTNTTSIAGGGTVAVNTTISGSAFTAGSLSAAHPGTATLGIHNLSNSSDPDATVNYIVNTAVTARFIDNVGGSTAGGVNYGSVLLGTPVTQSVTFDTENTGVPNLGSNALTIVTLVGTTAVSGTNGNFSTGTANKGNLTIAADPSGTNGNVTFSSGNESTSRNTTFTPLISGAYASNGLSIGFSNLALSYGTNETAVGLPATPTAGRITGTANVYQKASVTATGSSAGTLTLSNASATANVVTISGTVTADIGLRAAAAITSSAIAGQAGYSLGSGFEVGNVINAGTSISSTALFDTTGKLNGVYHGTVTVGLQHADQTIQGTAPNDLPNAVFTLATTVSGNSGSGTANILAGGSYAGYYINRGTGKNTTTSFLGGTASATTNLGVSFSTPTNTVAISDASTVTGTGTDKFVVQLSYDPAQVTNGATNSVAIAALNGSSKYTGAFRNDSDGGAASLEVKGAYNGSTTLGTYGVDTTNHTVWAVVDRPGTYAVGQRYVGDVNFDGIVNGLDTRQIYTGGAFNDGLATHTFSQGDMNGDGLVNGLDTRAIYTSGNFNNANLPAVAAAAKLTSPAADPTSSPIKVGTVGDGKPDLVYNPSTGDVTFTKDGYAATVVEILLHSDAGALNVANFNTSTGATANPNTLDVQSGNGFASYDFGNVLATGMTAQQVVSLLGAYTAADDPSGLGPSGQYIVNDGNEHFYDVVLAPEPASLSLVGVAAAGLLSRKRRKA